MGPKGQTPEMSAQESRAVGVCLITYTTEYRTGGPRLERVAETMAAEKGEQFSTVHLRRVESKASFVQAIQEVGDGGAQVAELHFIGHSGMYGPMFRTMAMPEQLSPHEWRTLDIPFSSDGTASFHACRTARWFAPFFARTFGVPAHGFHSYTTFSLRLDRFQWDGVSERDDRPLYLIGSPTAPGAPSRNTWAWRRWRCSSATSPRRLATRRPTRAWRSSMIPSLTTSAFVGMSGGGFPSICRTHRSCGCSTSVAETAPSWRPLGLVSARVSGWTSQRA
jgi:hypothetical protein